MRMRMGKTCWAIVAIVPVAACPAIAASRAFAACSGVVVRSGVASYSSVAEDHHAPMALIACGSSPGGPASLQQEGKPPEPPPLPAPPAPPPSPAPPVRTAAQTPPAQPAPASQSGRAGRVGFAAGVTIDWRFPLVEIESRIVFRAGPLELLACSPRTREHESILQVPARPQRMFEALGLIGLEPGAPVHYDAAADRWLPARGQKLSVRALADFPFGKVTIPVEAWMMRLDQPQIKVEPIPWVFAGSERYADGAFGADEDGTVACVVDFPTALITVGEVHTSANEALWLAATPRFIPKEGTPCSLIVSASREPEWTVQLSAEGKLRLNDRETDAKALADKYKAATDPKPAAAGPGTAQAGFAARFFVVQIVAAASTPDEVAKRVVDELEAQGLPPTAVLYDPRNAHP